MTLHVDLRSFWAGVRAMGWPHARVNYALSLLRGKSRGWSFCLWTPVWHEGRGPYICIRLGLIGFWRGY